MDHTYSTKFIQRITTILLFCTLFLVQCAAPSLNDAAISTPTPIPTTPPIATPTDSAIAPQSSTQPGSTQPSTPIISYFRANVTDAKPGDTLTIEWESNGGDTAIIQPITPSGELSPNGINVSPTGSIAYQIPIEDQIQSTLNLYVWQTGAESETAVATLSINLQCQESWFFTDAPDECPDRVRTSNATEQYFENGVMLWVEEFYWADSSSANNRTIYLFYDDLQFQLFTDEWNETEPQFDPELLPPPGLYQPLSGIGKIWRENPEIQAKLGWATAEEKEFVITMQAEQAVDYPHLYMQAHDGSIRHIWPTNYSWEPLP